MKIAFEPSGRCPAHRGTRGALLGACLALVGCSGLAAAGFLLEIDEAYRRGECASVLQLVDEGRSFLRDDPMQLAEAYFYRARCLARMGRDQEAVALFRYIEEQHPTTPFAYEAQALRAELAP